jgi:hypothetical protein
MAGGKTVLGAQRVLRQPTGLDRLLLLAIRVGRVRARQAAAVATRGVVLGVDELVADRREQRRRDRVAGGVETCTRVSSKASSNMIVVQLPVPAVPSAFSSEPALPRRADAIIRREVGWIVTSWLPLISPTSRPRPAGMDTSWPHAASIRSRKPAWAAPVSSFSLIRTWHMPAESVSHAICRAVNSDSVICSPTTPA